MLMGMATPLVRQRQCGVCSAQEEGVFAWGQETCEVIISFQVGRRKTGQMILKAIPLGMWQGHERVFRTLPVMTQEHYVLQGAQQR